MPTISEIRQQYPQYSDMSDADLASALHRKFYSDMPRAAFDQKIGLAAAAPAAPAPMSAAEHLGAAVTDIPAEITSAAKGAVAGINAGLNPFSDERRGRLERAAQKPFWDFSETLGGIADTGRAIASIPSLLASPLHGASRSLIGHPIAATGLMPYEDAKGAADTAMMAVAPRAASPASIRMQPAPAPTAVELRDAARSAYRSPEVTGVQIAPQSTANLAASIQSDLMQQGFRPIAGQGQRAFSITEELAPAQGAQAVGVADLDSVRKALGKTAREVDHLGRPTAEATAAGQAVRRIDDYLTNMQPADVLAGDAQRASQILSEARGNWAAASRSDAVDAKLTRAERQAARSGSGMNVENSIRQKVSQLLDSPSRTVGWSPEELAAAEQLVSGTPTRNTLRTVGKLGVDGGLSLLLHTGAAGATGGITIPLAVAGTAARVAGQALTVREAARLAEMMRARSPLAQSLPPQSVPLPSGLLGAIYPSMLPPGMGLLASLHNLNERQK